MPKIVTAKSDRAVRSLAKKPGQHSVGGVGGLVLCVPKTTCVHPSWVYRYQKDGKETREIIGTYPEISLADARKIAYGYQIGASDVSLNGRVKHLDVLDEQRRENPTPSITSKVDRKPKTKVTFQDLLPKWLDWCVERKKWKAGVATRNREELRIRKHLAPIMAIPLMDLQPEDLAKALSTLWIEMPVTAARVLTHAKSLFSWAQRVELCVPRNCINPADSQWVKDLLPPTAFCKPSEHYPFLDADQLPSLIKALCSYTDISVSARCAIVSILLCVRSSNIRYMKWEHLSDDLTIWTIPREEMKVIGNGQHKVPLSTQVQEILRKQRQLSFDTIYVFESPLFKGRPLSQNTINKFIRNLHELEKAAGREGWIDREQTARLKTERVAVMHGICRATFQTWSEANRLDWKATELILHHAVAKGVKSAYDRDESLPQKKELLQKWADFCFSQTDCIPEFIENSFRTKFE